MNDDILPIIHASHVGAVATLNPDGSPWNTPLHLAFGDDYIVFLSDERDWHSQNIARDPRVNITIWSGSELENVKGVYVQTEVYRVDGMDEVVARQIYAARFGGHIPEKFVDKATYIAPLGELNTAKTRGGRLYFEYKAGHNGHE